MTFTRASQPAKPRVYINTDLTLGEIESLELVGIFQNNWSTRTIKLYRDPRSTEHVYSVGRFHDGSAIVTSRERLSKCLDFRRAMDYWSHGKKLYVRD